MRHALSFRPRALLLAALLFLALSASARAQDDVSGSLGPEALAISTAINAARAENGLPALRVHLLLNQAAQAHVDDLIANNMYGHYGSDGSSVRTRVARTGYPSLWVSENWVTSGTPQGAMAWWMNDWIHRVNILDARWDEVGIGAGLVGNGFWIFVTDFADSDGQAATAALPAASGSAARSLPAAEATVPAGGMDYTIKGGDTLLAIGLRYGIEWQDIAVANAMAEGSVLQIGKVIRLPGAGAEVAAAVAALPSGGRLHTVTSGETLIAISLRFEIAWQDVAAANGISDPSALQVGMQLRLPGVPEEGDSEEPASSAEAGVSAEAAPALETLVGAAPAEAYSVQAGDTLSTIAAHHGISWQELAELNGLARNAVLQIGQSLEVPAAAVAPLPAGAPAAAPVEIAELSVAPAGMSYTTELIHLTPAEPTTPGAAGKRYTVKAGDTIISIAASNGLAWKRLLELNGLTDQSLIRPGQVLILE